MFHCYAPHRHGYGVLLSRKRNPAIVVRKLGVPSGSEWLTQTLTSRAGMHEYSQRISHNWAMSLFAFMQLDGDLDRTSIRASGLPG